jgi:hypothetical protein
MASDLPPTADPAQPGLPSPVPARSREGCIETPAMQLILGGIFSLFLSPPAGLVFSLAFKGSTALLVGVGISLGVDLVAAIAALLVRRYYLAVGFVLAPLLVAAVFGGCLALMTMLS